MFCLTANVTCSNPINLIRHNAFPLSITIIQLSNMDLHSSVKLFNLLLWKMSEEETHSTNYFFAPCIKLCISLWIIRWHFQLVKLRNERSTALKYWVNSVWRLFQLTNSQANWLLLFLLLSSKTNLVTTFEVKENSLNKFK